VISPSQRPLTPQDNTTYKHKSQTSMPRAGFKPETPATKRPQTYSLDRAATGIGDHYGSKKFIAMFTRAHHQFLSEMNPVYILNHCFLRLILILSSHTRLYVDWSLLFKHSNRRFTRVFLLLHYRYILRPHPPPSFDYRNDIWRRVRMMELTILQSLCLLKGNEIIYIARGWFSLKRKQKQPKRIRF
jgi:hypothetical protein